ncbi:MAG: (5-formylfuran-3-yl)methyl phosphate synthase [Dehalococcoidia bacterium]|tara:strand:+ start:36 stop:1010 length:975 start_codon:yes stop_codon:yes gene_type:complete
MILMVSVQDLYEAKQALKGGADIVDVKNLQEALVGSAHPTTFKQVRDEVPGNHHASLTLGVVPNQVGTVAMAVYAAGLLEATSVKVGFMVSEYQQALEILQASKEALANTETKLIGSLFADNLLYKGGIDPNLMVKLAKESQCDGWLIDTLVKDGRNLFDFIPEERLKEMVLEGKELGMSTALSGHLKMDDLDELARVNPDIVGVRGAVCQKGDRDSRVYWESVLEFKSQLDIRQSGEVDVYSGKNNTISTDNWRIIDGTGKTCAGIIAALSQQISEDPKSFVEVIIPDVLNSYDLVVWAEKNKHDIITQRKDPEGSLRMLIKP